MLLLVSMVTPVGTVIEEEDVVDFETVCLQQFCKGMLENFPGSRTDSSRMVRVGCTSERLLVDRVCDGTPVEDKVEVEEFLA